ncbi:MAG: adenylate/guanylate cyclase domain-containing protein, partial [Thermodesulfobacteriota bacterium]
IHVGISQQGSNQQVIDTVISNLIMAGALILLGIILAIPSALLFTTPVARIKNAMAGISQGNLEQKLPVRSRDELGVLTWNFNFMTDGLREKEKMRDRFGKAVSEEIVEVMMRGALSLGGEDKNVTMLFSDIRGFTRLSSFMSPAEVLEMLNEYFTIMEEIIKRNMGLVDKYVGDAVMAIFGAVDDNQDNEENACRAAVEMVCALEDLNNKRRDSGREPLAAGIGINTGTVTAGMLGSRHRMNYTVIGDTVNMASRLCDAAGTSGFAPILIALETYEQVKDLVKVRAGNFMYAKGKDEPVPVYELLGIVNRKMSLKLKISRITGSGGTA